MHEDPLRRSCIVLAVLAMLAGLGGMGMSFLYLAGSHPADIAAGQSGFVAGAVLIAAGLVSLSLLASRSGREANSERPRDDEPPATAQGDESAPRPRGITRKW
jgi:hypothetical protein